MSDNFRFLSLGWGDQSTALLGMAALGEIEPIKAAIFIDTTYERQSTLRIARELTPWAQERGVDVVWGYPIDEPVLLFTSPGDDTERKTNLPLHGYKDMKRTMLPRQCTYQWKIRAIRRIIRTNYYPFSSDFMKTYGEPVRMLLGITTDEWTRAKDSNVKWIKNEYPLLDMGMSRDDCIRWLQDHHLPVPGKSSCVHCPYMKTHDWKALARAGGADWDMAVRNDEAIRAERPKEFVHRDFIPLREFKEKIDASDREHQPTMFDNCDDDRDDPGMCDSGYCFM